MSVKLSWRPRHFFWLVIAVAVGAWLLFRGDGGGNASDEPLDELGTASGPSPTADGTRDGTVEMQPWDYYATATVGPYQFLDTQVLGSGDFVIYLLVEDQARPIVLVGVRIPESDPAGAVRYTEGFLRHAGVLFEFEPELTVPDAFAEQLNAPGERPLATPAIGYLFVENHARQSEEEPPNLMLNQLLLEDGLATYDEELNELAYYQVPLQQAAQRAETEGLGLYAGDDGE